MQNTKATPAIATTPKGAAKGAAKAPVLGKAASTKGMATNAKAPAAVVAGVPQCLNAGHFVAVQRLANPKAVNSQAHNNYAALLALVAKHGNGKFTVAQWAAVVQRASDLGYNTFTGGKGPRGKMFVTCHATQAQALAACPKAPKAAAPKAPKAKAPAAAPAAAPAVQG
jgi:hypothetical protein